MLPCGCIKFQLRSGRLAGSQMHGYMRVHACVEHVHAYNYTWAKVPSNL